MIGGIVYREQIAEWRRIKSALLEVAAHRRLPLGRLGELHEDVRTLLHSRAGPFVREVLETKVLPDVARAVLARVVECEGGPVEGLMAEWTHFYVEVLTTAEAIFVHIQPTSRRRRSIKHMALAAFRDHVLLAVRAALTEYLEAKTEPVPPTLRQALLVLQSVPVVFPVGDNQLRFEALAAMAISPFWGLKGLYEGRDPHPVIISRELFLRRPAASSQGGARSPAAQTRPLSAALGHHASTLAELFSLSAERCKHRMP